MGQQCLEYCPTSNRSATLAIAGVTTVAAPASSSSLLSSSEESSEEAAAVCKSSDRRLTDRQSAQDSNDLVASGWAAMV